MKSLNVLVAGGSRGMGLGIALELAAAGHQLMLTARQMSLLQKAAEKISASSGRKPAIVSCDLQKLENVKDIRKRANEVGFSPDVIVYSAGVYFEETLESASPEHVQAQFNVNLHACHLLVRSFTDILARSKFPRVIIIGSTAAFEPYAYGPVYGVTKWALRGLAENLRNELRPKRIGVTIVHPGATWTDLWAGEDLPRDRLLEVSDVAKLVATMLTLNTQAVVDELIVRPIEGDMHN